MLSKDQLDLLREIIFLDADAAAAHTAALLRIETPALRLHLEAFRKDHLHHLHALNTFLVRHGEPAVVTSLEVRHGPLVGRPPVKTKGSTRSEAALTAVTGCEHLVDRSYALLLRDEWPPELAALLRCHHAEEREHALWLHDALGKRLWEPRLSALP
jgi:predicted metal-dependent hydrolase